MAEEIVVTGRGTSTFGGWVIGSDGGMSGDTRGQQQAYEAARDGYANSTATAADTPCVLLSLRPKEAPLNVINNHAKAVENTFKTLLRRQTIEKSCQ